MAAPAFRPASAGPPSGSATRRPGSRGRTTPRPGRAASPRRRREYVRDRARARRPRARAHQRRATTRMEEAVRRALAGAGVDPDARRRASTAHPDQRRLGARPRARSSRCATPTAPRASASPSTSASTPGAASTRPATSTTRSRARVARALGLPRASSRASCSRAARSTATARARAHHRDVPAESEPRSPASERTREADGARASRAGSARARCSGSATGSRATTPTATSTTSRASSRRRRRGVRRATIRRDAEPGGARREPAPPARARATRTGKPLDVVAAADAAAARTGAASAARRATRTSTSPTAWRSCRSSARAEDARALAVLREAAARPRGGRRSRARHLVVGPRRGPLPDAAGARREPSRLAVRGRPIAFRSLPRSCKTSPRLPVPLAEKEPPVIEVLRHDVVIVGGGGAGLRAAIAAVEADPAAQRRARLEGLPDAQPHGLRRGRRRGGRARRRQPRDARLRHGEGLRLPRRPGRDPVLRRAGAEGARAARELGLPVEPQRGRHASRRAPSAA